MAAAAARRIAYPLVRRAETVYEKHGRKIPDPYQYLEDPNGEETKAFVKAQNEVSEAFINEYPHRKQLGERIEAMMNYPKTSAPMTRHGKWYFWHNTGLQNQSVLMRATSATDAAPEVFLDPNTLSADGTSALGSAAWSESETMYAYAIAEKGSDWHKIFVRDAATAKDLPADVVDWVKYSGISWYGDVGFFYTRYPASDAAAADKGAETDVAENPAVYYHRVGTAQAEDVEILRTPDHPKWNLGVDVSDCKKYLLAYISDGCEPKNLVRIATIPDGFAEKPVAPEFRPLIDEWVGEYSALSNNGPEFLFTTTRDAPNKKIVKINVETNEHTDVVAERESVLSFSAVVMDKLFVVYLENVKHVLYFRPWNGGVDTPLTHVPLPIGSIVGLSCRYDKPFVSIKMTSFLFAGRSYYFDVSNPLAMTVFRDDVVNGFDPDQFETKQVFVSSDDGAKIPMFIVHKKGVELNGKNPTLLYGYGGFNIALTPDFASTRIVFLSNLGGVLAIANIRGGGEFGEQWHDAGRKKNKENCFTDFIACAKWLHNAKYSSPTTLSIMGGSNGGLLVAACANRAPEQFRSVVAQVGVLDMYKFHQFTIGAAWRSDYGDPDVAEDFEVLERYSPLHNIRAGVDYPAIMCLTGDHDDRVVPLHTLKYVATLQHTNPDRGGPFLARVDIASGHGAGKPTWKRIQESTDTYAFIAKTLGAQWTD